MDIGAGNGAADVRILHVLKSWGTVGGIERYAYDLAHAHAARGHEVEVLAVSTKRRAEVREEGSIRIHLLPKLGIFHSATISASLPTSLARLRSNADVVHFHYPNPAAEASHVLLPDTLAASVATFHNEVVPTKPLYAMYRPVAERFLARMDRIIVTSPNVLDSATVLHPHRDKIDVVPLGIREPPLPERPSSHWSETAFPKILFVGRLGRYKGLPTLVKAMPSAPGHLVIAGEGPLHGELTRLVDVLDLKSRVTLIGSVSDSELHRLYCNADVLVLPSTDRGEGFGYVVLEAMSRGLPVITTEIGTGTSWANLHEKTGLVVPPHDSNALADAIRSLAVAEKLHTFRLNARNRSADFSLGRMIDGVDAVYRKAVVRR